MSNAQPSVTWPPFLGVVAELLPPPPPPPQASRNARAPPLRDAKAAAPPTLFRKSRRDQSSRKRSKRSKSPSGTPLRSSIAQSSSTVPDADLPRIMESIHLRRQVPDHWPSPADQSG